MENIFKLHITDTYKFSKIESKILEDELKNLPSIENDTLSIDCVYIYTDEDNLHYETCVILRNSLKTFINLNQISLGLSYNENIISKVWVDLSPIGSINSFDAVPLIIKFPIKEPINSINKEDAKIIFLDNIKSSISIQPKIIYMDPIFNDYELNVLNSQVSKLNPLDENNLNILANNFFKRKDFGIISLTMFNSTNYTLKICNLSLSMMPKHLGVSRVKKNIPELDTLILPNGVSVLGIKIDILNTPATLEELCNCEIKIDSAPTIVRI